MRIATITHEIHVADCNYNADRIIEAAQGAYEAGCEVAVFSAFAVSGCSCGDLFRMENLSNAICEALFRIKEASVKFAGMVLAVGFPVFFESCVAVIRDGEIIRLISRDGKLPCVIGEEFFETEPAGSVVDISGHRCVFVTYSEADDHLSAGSCIPDLTGKIPDNCDYVFMLCSCEMYAGCVNEYLFDLRVVSELHAQTFITVSSGPGESVDECVFSGFKAAVQGGCVFEYTCKPGVSIVECDLFPDNEYFDNFSDILHKQNGFRSIENAAGVFVGCPEQLDKFSTPHVEGHPSHHENVNPGLIDGFLPGDDDLSREYCLDILKIQAVALGERLRFLNMKKVILGLSGGLDSTLALVAAVNAFDRYNLDRKGIICVTMPGFGTSARTKGNAVKLADIFGVTFETIDIRDQVASHLYSIGQPVGEDGEFVSDVTFENAQARARTMILMDLANKENGIVVGTGDMSELALGWCTYNGDHMSNFSVNAGVPKTVIAPVLRTYVKCVADRKDKDLLSEIIEDIIDTPVSPELLPTDKEGDIVQKTEDSLGPYELHDFFLYQFLYYNDVSVGLIFEYALKKFEGVYDKETIYKTFKIFMRRFFSQQFKRSCMPVGPKVFKHSLSPRSGFLFPGDAYATGWLEDLEDARRHL